MKTRPFLSCLVAFTLLGGVVSVKAAEPTVFDLFDRGVMSIVAASACGVADPAALKTFRHDFKAVATAVEGELAAMNPQRTDGDLSMLVGFRVAQLELRATESIKTEGCDSAKVKAMAELFDMKDRLAKARLSGSHIDH